MWAEFKEKTYETAFVGELRLQTNHIYAPDQSDENFLGFDAAALLPFDYMPIPLPYMRFRRWRQLTGISASEIDRFGAEINRRLPPFRLNAFFQFKRPEYLFRGNAAEWTSWNGDYFRYGVGREQQKLLAKISEVAGRRGAVVYAAPAFHTSDDLFSAMSDEQIIGRSNVIGATLLDGHSRCTFADFGNFAMGHSEPTKITSPTLEELLTFGDDATEMPFTRHLKDAAEIIRVGLANDDAARFTLQLARRAIRGGDVDQVYPRAAGTWIDAELTIVAFSAAFGVRVCAIG